MDLLPSIGRKKRSQGKGSLQQNRGIESNTPPVTRKRGRRAGKKTQAAHHSNIVKDAMALNVRDSDSDLPLAKKPRGRPARKKAKVLQAQDEAIAKAVPVGDSESDVPIIATKRRGQPPGKKNRVVQTRARTKKKFSIGIPGSESDALPVAGNRRGRSAVSKDDEKLPTPGTDASTKRKLTIERPLSSVRMSRAATRRAAQKSIRADSRSDSEPPSRNRRVRRVVRASTPTSPIPSTRRLVRRFKKGIGGRDRKDECGPSNGIDEDDDNATGASLPYGARRRFSARFFDTEAIGGTDSDEDSIMNEDSGESDEAELIQEPTVAVDPISGDELVASTSSVLQARQVVTMHADSEARQSEKNEEEVHASQILHTVTALRETHGDQAPYIAWTPHNSEDTLLHVLGYREFHDTVTTAPAHNTTLPANKLWFEVEHKDLVAATTRGAPLGPFLFKIGTTPYHVTMQARVADEDEVLIGEMAHSAYESDVAEEWKDG